MAESFVSDGGATVAESTHSAEAVGLRLYLQEAMRLAPLPPREERLLLARVARGDAEAADEVARTRLGLVAEMVLARGPHNGDAFVWLDAGNLALLEAVAAFASSGEADFEAYAARRIACALDEAIGERASRVA